MTTQPVDSSILHEIVRVIESRRKVPERVVVKAREYLLTYLDDHQRRLEEALMRYDADRLNMLYGQLASKIKYQLLRRIPGRAAEAVGIAPARRPAPVSAKKSARPPAKPVARAKAASKPAKASGQKRKAAGKPARAKKKTAVRKRRR